MRKLTLVQKLQRRLMLRVLTLRARIALMPWRLACRFGFYCAVIDGTDCDGMRFSRFEFTWTRKGAEHLVDEFYQWADGPATATIVSGRQGRKLEAEHVPDNRDRFAERMGY